ncbi:Yos1-like-domain-containing protein [Aspergillus varians]
MLFFGLGRLVYVIMLITNGIAILSEDRFLARIGWGRQQADPAFGGAAYDNTSVKANIINLIASVRTVMRSTYLFFSFNLPSCLTRYKLPAVPIVSGFRGWLRWLAGWPDGELFV